MSILQNYQNKFKHLYEYFNKYIEDISFFNFNHIYYTDNMKEDIFLFCKPGDTEDLNNYGAVVTANDIIEDMIVLIDISESDDLMQSQSLIHELIHVVDYNNFATHYLNGNLTLINSHKLKKDYVSWSEFRAFSIAQIKCYEYMDFVCSTSYTRDIINQYELNIEDFLKRQHALVKSGHFSEYELSKVFGSIYLLDNYHNIENIKNSYIYKYLPILFKTDLIYPMYELYSLYFDSDRNQKIFENLNQICTIHNKFFQSQ